VGGGREEGEEVGEGQGQGACGGAGEGGSCGEGAGERPSRIDAVGCGVWGRGAQCFILKPTVLDGLQQQQQQHSCRSNCICKSNEQPIATAVILGILGVQASLASFSYYLSCPYCWC